MRWLSTSYAQTLSVRVSLKCRRIIESPWHQSRWGKCYQMAGDQNLKSRFENTRTGYRIASSVGGAVTGAGGDVIVVDDAHNVKRAENAAERGGTLLWWGESMSTRLNDPKTGAKVNVQQRAHEKDLAGRGFEKGSYVHLNLPMRFEVDRKCVTPLWEDPRTQDGELLWPDRFGKPEMHALEVDLGSYGAAGQLQQRPTPRGGGMLKRHWFSIVDAVPAQLKRVRFWDLAAVVP